MCIKNVIETKTLVVMQQQCKMSFNHKLITTFYTYLWVYISAIISSIPYLNLCFLSLFGSKDLVLIHLLSYVNLEFNFMF